jgi:hypothetical protein
MAEENAEVRVKLVVDDTSAETMNRLKEGMNELAGEAKKAAEDVRRMSEEAKNVGHGSDEAKKSTEGLAGEVFKGNAYFELMKVSVGLVAEGVKQAVDFTEKLTSASLDAAEAAEKQEKEMAGFLFLMDRGQHSMGELRDYTGEMREEFEKFGITSGVAVKDLTSGFEKLVEHGTMGSEKAKELTEQMAVLGRVVPGGMDALTQGMSQLEMGMARPRNAIVQLISVTQTLHGNAKAVAEQMKHMSPEAQMALAEKAINKQAEALKTMGAAVPDLGQLRASFGDIKEGFLESMGQPMMEALIPNLVKLRDFLAQHMEQIKAFGEKVGNAAANAIEYVSSAIQGIYSGLSQNWESFRDTFNTIFQDWEGAWNDSKTTTADIKKDFETIGIALKEAFLDVMRYAKAVVEIAMKANDVIHGRSAGATEEKIAGEGLNAEARSVGKGQKGVNDFEHSIDQYRAKAMDAGDVDPAAVEAYILKMRELHDAFQQGAEDDKAAVVSQNWDKLNEALNYNVEHHQDAMNDFILSQLNTSDAAVGAIKSGELHIAGGMDEFMKMINEKAPELAAKLRDAGNVVKNQGGIKPQAGVNIGVANFHIKQDFRDQDPDRIALVFKKDIGQAAVSRTASRVATPFGL